MCRPVCDHVQCRCPSVCVSVYVPVCVSDNGTEVRLHVYAWNVKTYNPQAGKYNILQTFLGGLSLSKNAAGGNFMQMRAVGERSFLGSQNLTVEST